MTSGQLRVEDLPAIDTYTYPEGHYRPVTGRGLYSIMLRCDVAKVDLEDPRTWGEVNWSAYSEHEGGLLVLINSYEGQFQ